MSAFFKVLIAAAALSAASSSLALASYNPGQTCVDHAYEHCR
jgi:hypothetical protein